MGYYTLFFIKINVLQRYTRHVEISDSYTLGTLAECPNQELVLRLLEGISKEMSLGLILVIAENARLIDPIHVRQTEMQGVLLVFAGRHSQVSVVHSIETEGEMDYVIKAELNPGASLELLSLHQSTGIIRVQQESILHESATMRWQNVTAGAGETHQDVSSRVLGRGGTSEVNWMFAASGKERSSLSVRNVFEEKEGAGEVRIRGIARDHAHVTARGMIEIGSGGGGTNTYLTEEVLMLDPTAKVDAIPALEIKTNDVKASHSATVARVTPEELFYFASRGIPAETAKDMYVRGFLEDFANDIASPALQSLALAHLATFAS